MRGREGCALDQVDARVCWDWISEAGTGQGPMAFWSSLESRKG